MAEAAEPVKDTGPTTAELLQAHRLQVIDSHLTSTLEDSAVEVCLQASLIACRLAFEGGLFQQALSKGHPFSASAPFTGCRPCTTTEKTRTLLGSSSESSTSAISGLGLRERFTALLDATLPVRALVWQAVPQPVAAQVMQPGSLC